MACLSGSCPDHHPADLDAHFVNYGEEGNHRINSSFIIFPVTVTCCCVLGGCIFRKLIGIYRVEGAFLQSNPVWLSAVQVLWVLRLDDLWEVSFEFCF